MNRWSILICCLLSVTCCLFAQVVHPKINKTVQSADGRISIELIGKKQFYDPSEEATAAPDINSPKSVNVHPNGKKFYVNSLEGATTVVYDFQTYKKLAVIKHQFDHSKDAHLWSKPSGLDAKGLVHDINDGRSKNKIRLISNNSSKFWFLVIESLSREAWGLFC